MDLYHTWTLLLFVVQVDLAAAVAINGACSTNSECTGTNTNTMCLSLQSSSCSQGICVCKLEYKWHVGDSKCKLMKFYLEKCDATNHMCMQGTSCTGGQCRCPGTNGAYNYALQQCVSGTTVPTEIGLNCNTVADCNIQGAVTGSVECVLPTGATGTQKKCKCKSGYMELVGTCKKPIEGQACVPAVGCTSPESVVIPSTDTSLTDPTCGTSTALCECSGLSASNINQDGYRYNSCLSSYSGTQLSLAQTCTTSNQCASGYCRECPGISGSVCIAAPTGYI